MTGTTRPRQTDVLLSSGFLGFASHLGFLEGVSLSDCTMTAIVGTSSGALVGSLFAAKLSCSDIQALLTAVAPIQHVRVSWQLWRGMFDLQPLIRLLEQNLPARFEDLGIPFAVGVTTSAGEHKLITSGPLAKAVAASCAVPGLFLPVKLADGVYRDGGASDRLGVDSWRAWRPERPGLVHRIERSMGRETPDHIAEMPVISSPRSHNSLWGLKDFDHERSQARARTCVYLDSKRSNL